MIIPGSATPIGPAAISFNGKLYVFFKSNSDNRIIYRYSTNNGSSRSSEIWLSSRTTKKPALCATSNYLTVAFKAEASNRMLFRRTDVNGSRPNEIWMPAGYATAEAPGVSQECDTDIMFYRKGETNNKIYQGGMFLPLQVTWGNVPVCWTYDGENLYFPYIVGAPAVVYNSSTHWNQMFYRSDEGGTSKPIKVVTGIGADCFAYVNINDRCKITYMLLMNLLRHL